MHGSLPIALEGASKSTDTATDKSVSNADETWFFDMCRDVLGPGAGTTMACLTAVHERYCWRYAGGTQPKAIFLRLLLRSERGGTILNHAMEGCTAKWWTDHRLVARKAALFDQARAIMGQLSI